MNPSLQTWWSWSIGGMLIASLGWNVALSRAHAPASGNAPATSSGCGPVCSSGGLSAGKAALVQQVSQRCCEKLSAVRTDTRDALENLQRSLEADPLDAGRVRAAAAELSTQRTQALMSCVECLIEMRDHLSAEELRELWVGCLESTLD